jgi:hypothetical protein
MLHQKDTDTYACHGSWLCCVGKVSGLAPKLLFSKELMSGDRYGGWVVPFAMPSWRIDDIFAIFGLWQSTRGLMLPGDHIVSLHRGRKQAVTKQPVLVGDFLDGEEILMAKNIYNDREQTWQVEVMAGSPPKVRAVDASIYKFYDSIIQSDRTLSREIFTMFDTLFTQILPLCTVQGIPIVTAAAVASYMQQISTAKQKVELALEKQEHYQWHL